MPNPQNLIPGAHPLTVQDQSKGGKASGKARKYKGDLRRAAEAVLKNNYIAKDGTEKSGAEILVLKLLDSAMKGNVRAFEVLRDTAGQKPVDKVEASQKIVQKTVDLSKMTDAQIKALLDKEV